MSGIDYNVDNYTISELLAILGLTFDFNLSSDPVSQENIDDINSQVTAATIRYKSQFSDKPQLILFFKIFKPKLGNILVNYLMPWKMATLQQMFQNIHRIQSKMMIGLIINI